VRRLCSGKVAAGASHCGKQPIAARVGGCWHREPLLPNYRSGIAAGRTDAPRICAPDGHVAEWLRNGLQNLIRRASPPR
jgi:hypothetical protein